LRRRLEKPRNHPLLEPSSLNSSTMMVVTVVAIVPIPVMMIAMPRHRLADDRAGSSTHDRADRSADGRASNTTGDGAPDGVFTSSGAGRRGQGDRKSANDNRNAHGLPPFDVVGLQPPKPTITVAWRQSPEAANAPGHPEFQSEARIPIGASRLLCGHARSPARIKARPG
jgi:hypothetical protein